MTRRVDRERRRRAPRLRSFRPHVDRMAVRVREPQAAAERVMRRVDLFDAALLHARADRGDAGGIAAEAQMVEALLLAFDQEHLVLIPAVAAEGENAVALVRRQTEGRIE